MSFSEGRYDVKKEPALRFPGFKGEWKRCKIDDIVVEYNERTTTNNQFEILSSTHEGIKFQKDHFNKVTASADTTGYKIVPKGFFTYRSMSDNGIFVFNQQNIINKGIVSPAYPVFDVIKADKMFFKQYINNTSTIKRELIRIKEGGTRYALSFSKLRSIVLQFPSLQEQQKIGSFLATIDALISETEKELEACREQKRGMLQKMFPKNGADVPEIRFPGFTDAWEQRKLLDCIEKITDFRGRTPKKLGMDWSESGYLALSALNVKDGYIDFTQDVHYGNQELYDKWMTGNELHKGQVLFTTEAPMGNVAQVPDNRRYILSQRTIAFGVKEDLITENFLATILRSPNVIATLTALSSGGTAKGVSQKSLSTVEIIIPNDLGEQERLANTFLELDHLITLHQRELDRLLELKKGFMQKMFC